MYTPPPFKLAANEMPDGMESASLRLAFRPKGDAKLAVSLDAEVKDFQPGGMFPGDIKLSAHVPDMDFKLNAAFKGSGATYTVKADASLLVTLSEGQEQFLLNVDGNQQEGRIELTNVGAKVKLVYTGSSAKPSKTAKLVSTEDGRELGTVEPDPQRPRYLIVKLKDGKTVDWELYPENLLPQPPAPASLGS